MPEITAEELGGRLYGDDRRPYILDVRHEEEFREWHIPGSENVDVYDELQDDLPAAREALSALPTEREIVTVCVAGVVSQRATDLLIESGREARTLVDGMNGWSRLHLAAPVDVDIEGSLVQVARPGKGCLSYILVSDGAAAVFDPSQYPDEYGERIAAHDAELVGVFDTHAHADHVSGGRDFANRHGVPYHLHPADAAALDVAPLRDGQSVSVGNVEVTVVHTPGHSPGGVTYAIADQAILTGDTLFHDSVGRVELGVEAGIEDTDVEGNAAALYESLRHLLDRGDDPLVLPAHDPGSPVPPVSAPLSEVQQRNDDLTLSREAFIEKLASDIPEHPPNFERVKRANIGLESVEHDELTTLELGPNRCAAE